MLVWWHWGRDESFFDCSLINARGGRHPHIDAALRYRMLQCFSMEIMSLTAGLKFLKSLTKVYYFYSVMRQRSNLLLDEITTLRTPVPGLYESGDHG